MPEHDEQVIVEKSSINIGGIIAAVAPLLPVPGLLEFPGVPPI